MNKLNSFIESSRLLLRRFTPDDFAALHTYRNDPAVAKYQSWTDKTELEIHTLIEDQKSLQLGIPGEWFMFAIILKKTGTLIGDCAFSVKKDDPRQAEIGITLSNQAQGQGFAHETIMLALNYLFENSKIDRIVLIADVKNRACIKLITNLHIPPVNPLLGYKGAAADTLFYNLKENELMFAVLKNEWLSAQV
jgi:RimJ/RimL family protein N-acetyltransferase